MDRALGDDRGWMERSPGDVKYLIWWTGFSSRWTFRTNRSNIISPVYIFPVCLSLKADSFSFSSGYKFSSIPFFYPAAVKTGATRENYDSSQSRKSNGIPLALRYAAFSRIGASLYFLIVHSLLARLPVTSPADDNTVRDFFRNDRPFFL